MKAQREHRVPLSDAALRVLHHARAENMGRCDDLVLPSTKASRSQPRNAIYKPEPKKEDIAGFIAAHAFALSD